MILFLLWLQFRRPKALSLRNSRLIPAYEYIFRNFLILVMIQGKTVSDEKCQPLSKIQSSQWIIFRREPGTI